MKILCIGHIVYDTVLSVENFPIENKKQRALEKIECGGGQASNAAYLLGKWNANVYICGRCGDDYQGNKIKEEFENVSINTKYLILDKNTSTDCGYIFANKETSSRTIISCRSEKSKKNIPISENFDAILVDKNEPLTAIEVLKNNKDKITIIDAERPTDETILLAHNVKYLVCSKDFAEEFTNKKIHVPDINGLKEIYDEITNEFNNQLIITLEEHGCFAKIGNDYQLIPSIKVDVKDTTAAGDIFHGAFAYFITKNYPLEKALYLSNITAALSTTKIGRENKIPDINDVLKMEETNDII